MKHLLMACAYFAALANAYAWTTNTLVHYDTAAPYLNFRSQSVNAARELAGWTEHVNLDRDRFYSSISITPAYTRSFHSRDIASMLFGNDLQGCDRSSIHIRGNALDSRTEKDWDSQNLYLPQDFKSNICFNPLVQNMLVDINLYLGLDEWVRNLYVRIHAPITHTRWGLQPFEDQANTAATTLSAHPALSTDLKSFHNYACAGKAPKIQTASVSKTESTYYFQGLRYSKICPCTQKKTGLSDIQTDIGWNFMRDHWHLGIFARVCIPTGNRPNGEYLFEPIIGNGKHWEIGGGLSGHAVLYEWIDQNRSVSFFCDANLTHMCKTNQSRVFDLCAHGPSSRYTLAKKESADKSVIQIAPIANLTRCSVQVKSALQADIVAMLNYFHNNFTLDLGYNFWARSCEKINCSPYDCCNSSCQELDGNTWFVQENSCIHNANFSTDSWKALKNTDLNIKDSGTRGISHKLFTHFSYNWFGHFERTVPYLGVGFEAELGTHKKMKKPCDNSTGPQCSPCSNKKCRSSALSQWSIFAKGGLSF